MAGKKSGQDRSPHGHKHNHSHLHGVTREQMHGATSMQTLSRISQTKQDEECPLSIGWLAA